MQSNVVEYFSGHDGYRCGYCKSPDTNFSHGMWAHSMSPDVYESLLNRGWRRSGKYLYKPTNNRTCCPCYTINCHVLDFHISKSQKKVLKKFNEYLLTGVLRSRGSHSADEMANSAAEAKLEVMNYKRGTAPSLELAGHVPNVNPNLDARSPNSVAPCPNLSKPDSPKRRKSDAIPAGELKLAAKTSQQLADNGHYAGNGKTQKAKFLRLERKRQKLSSRGLNPDEEFEKLKRKICSGVKEIEDFLQPAPTAKLKFEIRLVKVGSEEFDESFSQVHSLYQKYQMTIHDDDESECSAKQFRRFLCDNPLNEVSEDETGCYHQQYYVDNKLIAVGVIDILPSCLSSVYFFYDPAYMDLTLGTLGALREIAFVRDRARTHPKFQSYYMGFYIHSCPKMRYKGNYSPSYLLCPETFQWKLLDDSLREKLDKTKYLRFFSDSPGKCPRHENIHKVAILYRRNIMPFGIYELQRSKDDTKEIQEYCNLVGCDVAQNMCLYRSLS